MSEALNELVELSIPRKKVEKLRTINKTSKSWEKLVNTLEKIPSPRTRNNIINRILRKSKTDEKIIREKTPQRAKVLKKEEVKKPKFPEVKTLAEDLLKRNRKVKCLKNEPELKEKSQEFDKKEECKGKASYVCHHCGRNLCSQHSYWIPDEEFPYIVKKSSEAEIIKDEEQEKSANNLISIGVISLILGVVLTIFLWQISIPFFILGVILIYVGYRKKKSALKKVGEFYPTFIKHAETKWERSFKIKFEHKGYYTAVHCWNCLKEEHNAIYEIASSILDSIYYRSDRWKILKGEYYVEVSEDMRIASAVYAANKYLSQFKFSRNCYLPLRKGKLRILRRPKENPTYAHPIKENVYNPTPVWLFKPIQSIKKEEVPEITIETWLNQNIHNIKNTFGIK